MKTHGKTRQRSASKKKHASSVADASGHSTTLARPAVEVPANKLAIETIDIGQFWIALPFKLMTVWWDVWERVCKNVMAPSTAGRRALP